MKRQHLDFRLPQSAGL